MNNDLLLKDLCQRLPFGVVCLDIENNLLVSGDELILSYIHSGINLRPYLRPLKSMTVEEFNELAEILDYHGSCDDLCGFYSAFLVGRFVDSKVEKLIDFYLSHHFDYRDLISIKLAIEVPPGIY
jgi:hypothetical protein